jgi:hypothetical protein
MLDKIIKLFHKNVDEDDPNAKLWIKEHRQQCNKHLQTMKMHLEKDTHEMKNQVKQMQTKIGQSTLRKDHTMQLLKELEQQKF